jgi:hypothetical protein
MRVLKTGIIFFVLILACLRHSKAQDTVSIQKMDTLKAVHSPAKAALMSAILPGLGQIYNKKVWKVPVLYAGLAVNAYFLIYWSKLYRDYHQGYVNYQNYVGALGSSEIPDPVVVKQLLANVSEVFVYSNVPGALKAGNTYYRRYRDLNIFIMGGIYLLNIIDATVDAYLFNYDISDKLTLRVDPVMINTVAYHSSVGIKLTFNLH